MLKRLLTVILVLMLVVGVSGIASADNCIPNDIDDACVIDIDVDLDIDLNLANIDLADLNDNNIFALCQDGHGNDVGLVHQFQGGNLLVIDQPGHGNDVCFVWQDNSASLTGYNIATICQSGHGNGVGAVIQVR